MSGVDLRRFEIALGVFAVVLLVGTVGFELLLGEGWVDSFYRAVVSTTLTGLASAPDTDAAKIFTILLLFSGVAVFFYIAGVIVDVMTRGVLSGALEERRRKRHIDELSDHVIICGYGRVGRSAAAEFRATGTPCVVVDVTPESVELAKADGVPVVLGDGTEDNDLEAAGLMRARGRVASVDSDEKNLYITLSARARRPDLAIVARASDTAAARKIEMAGANRVVKPYSHAGLHMANLVVKPQVAAFLDIVTTAGGPLPELRFEQIVVTPECGRSGRSLDELRLDENTGAVVVALRRADGAFEVTPGPDTVLDEGDVLIGVGTTEEMRRLEEFFAPERRLLPEGRSQDVLTSLERALGDIAGVPVTLERPGDPEHGDYATNVALRLARERGQAPAEIASEIVNAALERGLVVRAEVAGPGFVNLHVSDIWLVGALQEILAAGESYGAGSASAVERIQVEMVSANPTGPLTVGSARNGAYGDSVARLLAFAGHEVEREYYYNDAGTQMDRFRESVDAAREGRDPPEDGYQGEYVKELATLAGDPVTVMLARIEATLERFRVHFDSWEKQSEVEVEIPEAIALLDTYEADGAIWARTSAHGDDKDRVLVRSDGVPSYFAADAAYIRRKFSKGLDRLVYVLGADHHGYVGRLQALAEMLGHPRDSVEVLVYQLVHLVEGGQAKKMSKRRGDVVFLEELLDTIGVDAARWYLVSRGHDQTIDIDVDLASEQSQKNPVYYVQYAHARIAGILRNAPEDDAASSALEPSQQLEPEERELVKRLLEFPSVVATAAERRAPHAVPIYAIRVADDFHRFYHEHRVLGEESEAFRLALCAATARVIRRSLDLIGVAAPDRM